ncbi:U-box domain-containing protein [Cryptosporidium felis]|nr:U-box domain-containing protein [Cryptosporidium felis]
MQSQREVESSLISDLLGISLINDETKSLRSLNRATILSDYSNELKQQEKEILLAFDDLDNIIYHRLKQFFAKKNIKSRTNAFQFLIESFNKFISESSIPKQDELNDKLVNSLHIFPKYCALIIQCPELFEASDIENKCVISDLFELSIPISFFNQLLIEMESNDSRLCFDIFTNYIEVQMNTLKQRKFTDLKLNTVKNIIFLSQFKAAANIIVQVPSFIKNKMNATAKPLTALIQQQESLLGCMIAPNPIDRDPKTNDIPALNKYFSGLLTKSHHQINQNKILIKQELSLIYEQSILIIKNLLKANTDSRRNVLKWMSIICTSNEGKSKVYNSIPDIPMFGNTGNSREIQSNLRALIIKTSGFSTHGFSINFLHIILKLLQPVRIEKIPELDSLFHLYGKVYQENDIGNEVKALLGELIEDATLGEREIVEVAKKLAKEKLANLVNDGFRYQDIVKFPTQIFWLSCKSIKCFMYPVLLEYENKLQDINDQRNGLNSIQRLKDSNLEALSGEALLLETLIFHQGTISAFWHFLSLFIHFIFRTIFSFNEMGIESSEWSTHLVSKQGRITLVLKSFIPPTKPSPQFSSLPSSLIEDILSVTELLFRIKGNDELMVGFDFDSYISFVITVINYGNYFKNPHIRSQRAVIGIYYLLQIHQFRQRIENNDFCADFILPSLISLFNDVQRSPYFDRFSLRLPIIMLFETLLKIDLHRKSLHVFVKEKDESFTKFIHLLVSDLNYLLEEGLSMLAEIKKRESKPSTAPEMTLTNHSESSVLESTQVNSTQEGINNTIEEMPLERLEHACKGYMQLSHASASLLQKITEYYTLEILDSPLILPQIVTCLNCTLDRLVGPKCLELKVSNFEAYNFNPRQLLVNVCMTYVTLAFQVKMDESDKNDTSKLLSEIINEQRYFKIHTFIKAHYIARREGLITANKLDSFNTLIKYIQKELEENESGQYSNKLDEVEIPEEFLDPIMQEIMQDPVLLPTSSKIMDRKVIERILISDGVDPFNRLPLSKEDLVPQESLREKIEFFLRQL